MKRYFQNSTHQGVSTNSSETVQEPIAKRIEQVEGSPRIYDVFSICFLHLSSRRRYSLTFYLLSFVRMKRVKGSLLIMIMTLLSLQLSAQEKWTLNDCISYAIKNNLQLQDAEVQERLAGENYRQSKWNL
jgi:hypothetical protein